MSQPGGQTRVPSASADLSRTHEWEIDIRNEKSSGSMHAFRLLRLVGQEGQAMSSYLQHVRPLLTWCDATEDGLSVLLQRHGKQYTTPAVLERIQSVFWDTLGASVTSAQFRHLVVSATLKLPGTSSHRFGHRLQTTHDHYLIHDTDAATGATQ